MDISHRYSFKNVNVLIGSLSVMACKVKTQKFAKCFIWKANLAGMNKK